MAKPTKASSKREEDVSGAEDTPDVSIEKEARTLQQFFMKFGNDWVMGFASGLAFNLLAAIFPIFIALLSLFGLIVGRLDPGAKATLTTTLQNVFPPPLNHQNVLEPALTAIHRSVGFLGIVAVLMGIIGGSGLFVSLEGYFDIIYHARPRNLIQQYAMAISMLLFFLILIPVMVFAGTLPALVLSLLKVTPLNSIPSIGLLFSFAGIFTGLLISWVFFLVIYIVVPHQPISFRNSWRGAAVAAIALQLYLVLFPLYVTHFLVSDTGTTGFAVILLFFFYYFAVILLLGAEVNAFFVENIRVTPDNVAAMIHSLTSHLPTSEQAVEQQASVTHKDEEPKEILPQGKAAALHQQARLTSDKAAKNQERSATMNSEVTQEKARHSGKPRTHMVVEVLTVAVVTVLVEFFRQRRGK
jgi:membrane protein